MIDFIIVVFPVPGPPVIISIPFSKAPTIASLWELANLILFFLSKVSISNSTSVFIVLKFSILYGNENTASISLIFSIFILVSNAKLYKFSSTI